VPPSPPPPPTSFAIRPALDTARLNDPPYDRVWFVAERADSTVDLWTVSDSSIAQVYPRERGQVLVFARRPGTVTITARRGGDSGQATLVIPPFTIKPILDTLKVGEQVTFGGNHFRFPYDEIQWFSSDSARAPVTQHEKNWATVLAQGVGTVTITATHRGDTARATLVIREAQSGEWESIDLGVLDAATGEAIAIGDDGSVVGSLDGGSPDYTWRGFFYRDGAMRKLPTTGDRERVVAMGPSGKIAGIAYVGTTGIGQVVIWDTPDAAPRRLDEPMGIGRVDINERGDVLITTHNRKSILWRDNVRVDLGDLGDSTVQFPETYAQAWNNRGQIVGWTRVTEARPSCSTSACGTHPFLWENGVMRDLGVLAPRPCPNMATPADCSRGNATGINASGVVVGTADDAQGVPRAFIWENGVMRDLGVAPGHLTQAIAINDRGQVMGSIGSGCTTFLWENGQAQIIEPLCPTGLGPHGEVLGWWAGSDGDHAFMRQAGQLIDLGLGEPRAINANGEVAGVSNRCCLTRPKLWRKKP
jgi:probable HAF family extracellular repeat protein